MLTESAVSFPPLLPSDSQREEVQIFWKAKEMITAFYLATKHEMANCLHVLNCWHHQIHYEYKCIFLG